MAILRLSRVKKTGVILKMVFVLGIWVALPDFSTAQAAKPPANKAKTVAPPKMPPIQPDSIKVPAFTVRFGPYRENMPALADDLKKLVGTELIVTDQQGQRWTTIFFRFVWNRKEESDDWKTGKRKTIFTYSMTEVEGSPKLPESWQKEFAGYLQPGEDIIFEQIIIEHPGSKRKTVAKDLKIKIL